MPGEPQDRSAAPSIGSALVPDRFGLPAALLAPLAVTAAIVPFRDENAPTNSALVLVLVIVAVASVGTRLAGMLAAVSAAAWFDFLLTEPYQRFVIADRTNAETAILLLLVGLGVTQLAVWGRRQHVLAEREAGYLEGIRVAAAAVASGRSSGDLVEEVGHQVMTLLGLRSCRFEYGVAGLGRPARLRDDGRLERDGVDWDVDGEGLPVGTDIELLVESGGQLQGRYLLSAGPNSRPSRAVRLVAVTLAAQVGAALR